MRTIYIITVILLMKGLSAQNVSPVISGCEVFPKNNIWNMPIDGLKKDKNSEGYLKKIGLSKSLKADFGSGLWEGAPIGIPYNISSGKEKKIHPEFEYSDESDKGLYPIPAKPLIEGGPSSKGDRHILILDNKNCILYELYSAYPLKGGGWKAGSGAVFDLKSNALRPDSWTSADAAGLPILPGLVRYDEIAEGEIRHAIRFTVSRTQKKYVWPARHYASKDKASDLPPMGQRFRLKAEYDISGFSKTNQIILKALKKYGMILADNGSSVFISGVPDERWNNDDLNRLKKVKASDFEAVDSDSLMKNRDSGEAGIPKK